MGGCNEDVCFHAHTQTHTHTIHIVEVHEGVKGVEEECLAQEDAGDCEACFCPTSCQVSL